MSTYDLIVLGGGPAGYLAAERAGHAGLKTLLIEANSLGGVCLNEGCIPSKALLNSAKLYHHAVDSAAFGVTTTGAALDHSKVLAHKNKVVSTLVKGVGATLKRNGVTVIKAKGIITGRADGGFAVETEGSRSVGSNLLVATGSAPVVPPIPGLADGLEQGWVVTNKGILDLPQLPKHLAIIGGGVIGLEMAAYFVTVGCQVTVVEMLDRIGGGIDSEISAMLLQELRSKGVTFELSTKVTALQGGKLLCQKDGQELSIEADRVLLSIGRRPVTDGLGLETLGVYLERGAIKTDSRLATNIPGVFAAGDVNGISMLAHTAYREAEVVVNNLTGKKDHMRYDAIAGVIYTSPEVACVGETQQSATEKGYRVRTASLPMAYSGRFLAEGGSTGVCKLVADEATGRLLGAHLMGSYTSEFIVSAAMMIETRLPVQRLREMIFPHPTVAEILHEALYQL